MKPVKHGASLAENYPSIEQLWNYEKNHGLTPRDVSANSHKSAYFYCAAKKHGSFSTRIQSFFLHRNSKSKGCPYCAGKRIAAEDSLKGRFDLEMIAAEWDYGRNTILPEEMLPGSKKKKVYWCCSEGHPAYETVYTRVKRGGCMDCLGQNHNSYPQQIIFYYISRLQPGTQDRAQYISSLRIQAEIDILVPFRSTGTRKYLGIEVDGIWHRTELRQKSDMSKNRALSTEPVLLIRIRDKNLPDIEGYGCKVLKFDNSSYRRLHDSMKDCLVQIGRYIFKHFQIPTKMREEINNWYELDIEKDSLAIRELYKTHQRQQSIEITHPQLAKQFHPMTNGTLRAYHFRAGSSARIWWHIESCGHDFQSIIKNRVRWPGCPKCRRELITDRSDIMQYFDEHNNVVKPETLTVTSLTKVYWKCGNPEHPSYLMSVRRRCDPDRQGDPCPVCRNRKAISTTCLAVKNVKLARQWDGEKNASLTPWDVTTSCSKQVWWRCEKGHSYQMPVNERHHKGSGCPYCSNRRVCMDNCLAIIHPAIAAELHPTLNGLTAYDVTAGCAKKLFWACTNKSKNHPPYQSSVNSRVNGGTGCPRCQNKLPDSENCVAVKRPDLAAQFHPTRNASITPFDILPQSHRKYWWLCSRGHEFYKSPNERKDSQCPTCKQEQKIKLGNQFPHLVDEWHPTLNGSLTIFEVTKGSEMKVYWKCSKGHVYQQSAMSKSKGSRCPYCMGKLVAPDTNLAELNPKLAVEWDHSKNEIGPRDVTPGSNKKVWWTCKNGHSWVASIKNRTRGTGCPYCAEKKRFRFM